MGLIKTLKEALNDHSEDLLLLDLPWPGGGAGAGGEGRLRASSEGYMVILLCSVCSKKNIYVDQICIHIFICIYIYTCIICFAFFFERGGEGSGLGALTGSLRF